MIFVTAMIIGIAAGLQRSAIGSILGAALVSIAFMAAVAASAVPPPLMTLFVALGGYNLGFIGYLVTLDRLEQRRA
ncbi:MULTISPECIES: homogentisate export protein [Rhizobium]|uniref:CHASE2 domain-containing sensor protein n=1 Tax=Rhizobium paranaense TaxID=1650438 RepID=A0A7W8XTW9_9HYPH|nr:MULTISPECIES: homogentisate export protein [Rhizobium]MBB5575310.1 CHASE2 domain-containing sensor protein [Rhizobium paranaense]PST64289.1 homogentisate export protein [Rhizobium sp. SEMIA4064]